MKLRLVTNASTEKSLIGELFLDTDWECYTMENPDHLVPEGEYQVIINESQRFKRRMPLLVNVPGREGIRIHVANWAHELDGCIAVGRTIVDPDMIGQSRIAFDRLFFKLDDALTRGESVSIQIIRFAPEQPAEVQSESKVADGANDSSLAKWFSRLWRK